MAELENSFVLTVNGCVCQEVEDADESTIAHAFRRMGEFAEVIERHGLAHALRVLSRDSKLRKIVFAEAVGGSGLVSTMVGTSKH